MLSEFNEYTLEQDLAIATTIAIMSPTNSILGISFSGSLSNFWWINQLEDPAVNMLKVQCIISSQQLGSLPVYSYTYVQVISQMFTLIWMPCMLLL